MRYFLCFEQAYITSASLYREIWLSEVMERLLNDSELWQKVQLHSHTAAEGLEQVCCSSLLSFIKALKSVWHIKALCYH